MDKQHGMNSKTVGCHFDNQFELSIGKQKQENATTFT
jgi:hypothetical protein